MLAVQRVLARATWQKLVAGQTADDVYPEAVADADRAFALLQTGTCDATDAASQESRHEPSHPLSLPCRDC